MRNSTLAVGLVTIFCGYALFRMAQRSIIGHNPGLAALLDHFISDESSLDEHVAPPTQPRARSASGHAG